MNHQHVIEQIYGYPELSPQEKAQVDEHLLHCASCRERFKEFNAAREAMMRVAKVNAMPENASRLTANIMAAVHDEMNQPRKSLSWLDRAFVRYAMVACSFGLLLMFFVQQLPESPKNYFKAVPARTSSVLNTSLLLNDTRDNILHKTETRSWYACIRVGTCDHPVVQKIKQSISHENQ